MKTRMVILRFSTSGIPSRGPVCLISIDWLWPEAVQARTSLRRRRIRKRAVVVVWIATTRTRPPIIIKTTPSAIRLQNSGRNGPSWTRAIERCWWPSRFSSGSRITPIRAPVPTTQTTSSHRHPQTRPRPRPRPLSSPTKL